MGYESLTYGNYYHIYNCGNNKEDIFIEEKNYYYFLTLLKKYIVPVADILSYCLLKNHFHLVIYAKENIDDKGISQSFSNFFNAYAKAINKLYGRTGSLFKDRFSRIKIKDENYLKYVIVYTNANPTHHGFTEHPKDYKHSSYLALISDNSTNLKRSYVISLFGDVNNFIGVINQKQQIITALILE